MPVVPEFQAVHAPGRMLRTIQATTADHPFLHVLGVLPTRVRRRDNPHNLEPGGEHPAGRLSAKERVEAIRQLATLGLGVREISRRTGLTPATISKWVRLADKPAVMQALEAGRIDLFRAMQIAPIKDPAQQEALLAQAPSLSKQDFSALAQHVLAGETAYCLDDGRLADVDRKLALVRQVTPLGLTHLRRIITTAVTLLAAAEGEATVAQLEVLADQATAGIASRDAGRCFPGETPVQQE